MSGHSRLLVSLAFLGAMVGCRAATRVVDTPRVDQDLSGGNRGYLVGTPPPAADLDPSRQIVETEIEVPTFARPQAGTGQPVSLQELSPPELDWQEETAGTNGTLAEGSYSTYVVKTGDTLWSIAADLYGQATRWRAIYEANRDVLHTPDRLRPGMSLRIPQGSGGAAYTK